MFPEDQVSEMVWNFDASNSITALISDPAQAGNFLMSSTKDCVFHLDVESLNVTTLIGQYNING